MKNVTILKCLNYIGAFLFPKYCKKKPMNLKSYKSIVATHNEKQDKPVDRTILDKQKKEALRSELAKLELDKDIKQRDYEKGVADMETTAILPLYTAWKEAIVKYETCKELFEGLFPATE